MAIQLIVIVVHIVVIVVDVRVCDVIRVLHLRLDRCRRMLRRRELESLGLTVTELLVHTVLTLTPDNCAIPEIRNMIVMETPLMDIFINP